MLYETRIPTVKYLPPDFEAVAGLDAVDQSPPAMEAPPITSHRDDVAVWNAAMSYHADVMAALRRTLRIVYGLDLDLILASIKSSMPEFSRTPLDRLHDVPFAHHISVAEATTQEDVVNAYKMLRASLPASRVSNRPPRDPLTCVQCAIWRKEFGWSYQRIGEVFNWTIQRPPGQKPRCENARLHVVEGCRILLQRMAAA